MNTKLGEVCEHGHLKRSCDLCDAHDHIAWLEDAVAMLARELAYRRTTDLPAPHEWRDELDGNPIAREAIEKARNA
jgi:hypothetical protein